MSNELDIHTSAFDAALPGFSPKGLLEALEDPGVFREMSRADLYVQMIMLREQMKNPSVSPERRLKYMEQLQKMARLPAQSAEDAHVDRPMIQIVFSGVAAEKSISAQSAVIASDE